MFWMKGQIMKKKQLLVLTTLAFCTTLYANTRLVSEHGIVADGNTDNADALQAIIDNCSKEGGGTVVIDKGTVVSGTIRLKNNVTLEIAEGATLKCVDSSRSTESCPTPTLDFHCLYTKWRAFIYAHNQENIAITGKGTIDGDGGTYNPRKDARVQLVRFDGCTNVTVKDIKLVNTSLWTQHYFRCDKVRISNVTVDNSTINMINDDGLNIDGCHDVIIDNCNIKTLDDCITLKNTSHRASRDVTITNCRLETKKKSAFKFGTESYDGFINVTARNLEIKSGHKARDAIALLTVDGAKMENILIEDVKITDMQCPVFIRLASRLRPFEGDTKELTVGSVDGVTIRNVTATGATRAIMIAGLPDHRINNINLENIDIEFKSSKKHILPPDGKVKENDNGYPKSTMFGTLNAWGLFVRHAENITLKNVNLTNPNMDDTQKEYFENVNGVKRQ